MDSVAAESRLTTSLLQVMVVIIVVIIDVILIIMILLILTDGERDLLVVGSASQGRSGIIGGS